MAFLFDIYRARLIAAMNRAGSALAVAGLLAAFFFNTTASAQNKRSSGDRLQAIADHSRSIKQNPGNANTYYNRGNEFYKLGKYQLAINDYNSAIELNPKFAEAYNNRGMAYGTLANYRQSISDYSNAIELNPKYTEAYYNRGVALSKAGNDRMAIQSYKMAAKLGHYRAQTYLTSKAINWKQ